MRKAVLRVAVSLGLAAILAPATDVAADARVHGRGAGRLRSGHQRPPAFHKHGIERHRAFPRHFSTLGVFVGAPVVVYTPPPVVFSTPLSTPAVYAPPVVFTPPPPILGSPPLAQPAPPMPRVVEHPTGRYELRGDGIATPYTWVWIPNPPPAPPPPPPPPAAAPTSGDALPAREQVYQWVDEQGVAHWTNRVDRIPRPYREEARR